METKSSPSIESFVIRFVLDETAPANTKQPAYRGAIRHIQSDQEMHFNNWVDAVEFIQRYVTLEPQPG
jgi:hypothetical protein